MHEYRTALLMLLAAPWVVVGLAARALTTNSDGFYTVEQAKRGQDVYVSKCSECHDGGIMGPELWGKDFLGAWEGKNVRALFDAVKGTMPADAPGSLSERDAVDVVAYILRENDQPEGASPLVADVPPGATITRGSK